MKRVSTDTQDSGSLYWWKRSSACEISLEKICHTFMVLIKHHQRKP